MLLIVCVCTEEKCICGTTLEVCYTVLVSHFNPAQLAMLPTQITPTAQTVSCYKVAGELEFGIV